MTIEMSSMVTEVSAMFVERMIFLLFGGGFSKTARWERRSNEKKGG